MTMPSSGPLNMGGTSSPVSVAQELGLSLTAQISMNDAAVRTLAGVAASGAWSMNSLYGKSNGTQKGIFAFGCWNNSNSYSVSNIVSNTGTFASDTSNAITVRNTAYGCTYGGDKGIIGFAIIGGSATSITNLVSNTGVIAANTTGVGTARFGVAACNYGGGGDKGIFAYGQFGATLESNLISNTGVVASGTIIVGTIRQGLAACGYGSDKGIFGYGKASSNFNVTNLVSNTGVVAADTSGVGTSRNFLAACGYGTDKGIFGYGQSGIGTDTGPYSMTNLVSNTGVVASDTTGVGTARQGLAACIYNIDKGVFAYGGPIAASNQSLSMSNKVSNSGVVATDTTGVGTPRTRVAACGFSSS
jgi:hypothetical protein